MFTGIIEEVGLVESIDRSSGQYRLSIRAPKIIKGTNTGDSIAVNGICLTAAAITGEAFQADVMGETMRRTNLGSLSRGGHVNLERAMALNGRFGGHIVSGHIDGTGTVLAVKKEGNAYWYQIQAKSAIMRYIVEKGSIAIDGISLTVALVQEQSFFVSVIPHTRKETILGERKPGSQVNLENDLIGKYIERLCLGITTKQEQKKSDVTLELLQENGFL